MQVNRDLLKLVAENPDLPIVAMVDSDVCWDGPGYWMASFTSVAIAEIGIVGERFYDDRDSFMEAYYDKYDDELTKRFNYHPCLGLKNCTPETVQANNEAEEKLDSYLEEMADKYMKKAIVVYVNEPDISKWEVA